MELLIHTISYIYVYNVISIAIHIFTETIFNIFTQNILKVGRFKIKGMVCTLPYIGIKVMKKIK